MNFEKSHRIWIICSLIVGSLLIISRCEAIDGIKGDASKTIGLLNETDFDQVDLLTRCVGMRSMNSDNLHVSIEDKGLLEGLARATRIELEAVYIEPKMDRPSELEFVQGIREKFLKPCNRFQEATNEWQQQRIPQSEIQSESVKSWLAAGNICSKLIAESRSLISKSFKLFERQIGDEFRMQKQDPTWFANRALLVLSASSSAIGDEEALLPKLWHRVKLQTTSSNGGDQAPSKLHRAIPRRALVESIGALCRSELNLSAAVDLTREEFDEIYRVNLVKPCKYAYKILHNWSKEYRMRDQLSEEEKELLRGELICQIVLDEAADSKNNLRDEAFDYYKTL